MGFAFFVNSSPEKKGEGGGQRPEAVFVIPMNDKPDAIPPLRNEKVTQGVSVIPV